MFHQAKKILNIVVEDAGTSSTFLVTDNVAGGAPKGENTVKCFFGESDTFKNFWKRQASMFVEIEGSNFDVPADVMETHG